jgi:hypothetical protein
LRSTASLTRWNRLVASAPMSTMVPVARLKSAMKRTASTTLETIRSSAD